MADFSLASVIMQLPQVTCILFRPSQDAIVKGFRQGAGEETATNFSAHVQPTKPAELRKIEGGESVESAISLWTNTVLRTADDNAESEADRVECRGKRYKIISAADWSGQGFRKFIGGEVAARAVE